MSQIALDKVTFAYEEQEDPVFANLSIEIPPGIISLVGQNGTGKSTFLLLASGILVPNGGDVFIQGTNTKELRSENERHKYVSYIFQNMEFETQENIGDLLEFVYSQGFYEVKDSSFIPDIVSAFELEDVLMKKTQEISKGELQRTILAFSLLYGSSTLMMDEPIFALESYQKHRAMEFIQDYGKKHSISIYFSAHEIDITRKYSDKVLLFFKDCHPELGDTESMLSGINLERAYDIPYAMLKDQETLYRENIGIKYKS